MSWIFMILPFFFQVKSPTNAKFAAKGSVLHQISKHTSGTYYCWHQVMLNVFLTHMNFAGCTLGKNLTAAQRAAGTTLKGYTWNFTLMSTMAKNPTSVTLVVRVTPVFRVSRHTGKHMPLVPLLTTRRDWSRSNRKMPWEWRSAIITMVRTYCHILLKRPHCWCWWWFPS